MARDVAKTGLDPTDRTAIALLGLATTDYSSWFDNTKEIRTGLPYASVKHLASEMNLEVTKHLFGSWVTPSGPHIASKRNG